MHMRSSQYPLTLSFSLPPHWPLLTHPLKLQPSFYRLTIDYVMEYRLQARRTGSSLQKKGMSDTDKLSLFSGFTYQECQDYFEDSDE